MAIEFRVSRIDCDTWAPGEELSGVKSISVSRSDNRDGTTPLMDSGSIEVEGTIEEGYYQIDKLETGHPVEPIAAVLLVPDVDDFSHGQWCATTIAKSVLTPAADKKFDNGACVHKGQDGASWVAEKLRETVKAPVVVDGSFTLDRHYVFNLGETYLDGCWKVLSAAGWCLQISERGVVRVMPVPSTPSVVYDSSAVRDQIGHSIPIDDVYNVVRVWDGENVAEAINDDPDSPTSIRNRNGRRIEYTEESPALVDGETLDDYANRKLDESSAIYETYEIERDWIAGTLPYTCARVYLPEAQTQCVCSVMRQEIECKTGISVRETVGRRADGKRV